MKAGRELPKEKENFDGRYRQREDSKRMEGWVSGRGNKRGSKSRPGPGVANERAPAGSSKGVWASRDVTRSVTLPPLPPTINDATLRFPLYPAPFRPSGSFLCHPRFDPFELNRVLVPVLKGAAAVSATWQPCLYLAPFYTISHSRHFVAHLFLSPIYQPSCTVVRGLSLSLLPSPILSLYLFLSVWPVSLAIPFPRWYKQRDCASVEFSCRWFEQRLISAVDKGTSGIVPSWSPRCQHGVWIAVRRCSTKI